MLVTGKNLINAIEIIKGQTKVGTGSFKSIIAVVCHEDGGIEVTFDDSTKETVQCVKGESFSLGYLDVKVLGGKFTVN